MWDLIYEKQIMSHLTLMIPLEAVKTILKRLSPGAVEYTDYISGEE